MEIKVMIFGQLTDIVNSNMITLTDIADTNNLVNVLKAQYPSLNQAKYIIAVDRQTVTENTTLKDGSTVALLPPFSGG